MNRKIKKEVLALLAGRDLEKIREALAKYDEKGLVNPLFSALARPEERVRWHAVTLFGEVLFRLASRDMEAARVVMRRFLWSLNDESGGIGWGAPEAMAEAMVHHDGLCDEYVHMLISYMRPDGPLPHQDGNFLELPQLQRGLLWGIGRLAQSRAPLLRDKGVAADLIPYLQSPDGEVCGLAARALGLLDSTMAAEPLQQLLEDGRQVVLYEEGQMVRTTVGHLVANALEGINNSHQGN